MIIWASDMSAGALSEECILGQEWYDECKFLIIPKDWSSEVNTHLSKNILE